MPPFLGTNYYFLHPSSFKSDQSEQQHGSTRLAPRTRNFWINQVAPFLGTNYDFLPSSSFKSDQPEPDPGTLRPLRPNRNV